jgi:large subunit ribosomal protein L11
MAKEVKAVIKLQIAGGSATPAPPVGSALGPHGVKAVDFCKLFNEKTASRKGETVPVVVTVYKDRTFDFVTKTVPVSEMVRKEIGLSKGSKAPGKDMVGKISWKQIEKIAQYKMVDLNAFSIESAKKVIAGSAKSMGLKIED